MAGLFLLSVVLWNQFYLSIHLASESHYYSGSAPSSDHGAAPLGNFAGQGHDNTGHEEDHQPHSASDHLLCLAQPLQVEWQPTVPAPPPVEPSQLTPLPSPVIRQLHFLPELSRGPPHASFA